MPKKKTAKKKIAKKTEAQKRALDIRINEDLLKEVEQLKDRFGLPDEGAVLFRALALLKEANRRDELGYDLCFIERNTGKIVAVNFGDASNARGTGSPKTDDGAAG